MAQEREPNGRFKKGVTPKGAKPISEGVAKDYQLRSAAKRKENKELAEWAKAYVNSKDENGVIIGDKLIQVAVKNHLKDGNLTFNDLCNLKKLLGEEVNKTDITNSDGSLHVPSLIIEKVTPPQE